VCPRGSYLPAPRFNRVLSHQGSIRPVFPDNEPTAHLRVLFLAKLFPWPLNFGARQRVFHLARGIAKAHDEAVIAYDTVPIREQEEAFLANSGCSAVSTIPRRQVLAHRPVPDHSWGRLLRKLRSVDMRLRSPLPSFVHDVWSSDLVNQLRSVKRSTSFDVVYATQSWMAEHALAAGFDRIIVDVDDLLSHLSRQRVASSGWHSRKPIELFDAAKDQRYERSLPKRFMRVVVAKEEDRSFFAPADRERVSVIPNGITVPEAPSPEPAIANTILFVGTLGYGPNIDAIGWFATEILPLIWQHKPDVSFSVAGYGAIGSLAEVLKDPRCIVHESPADLAPLYDEASLVVTPIRIGGGTRIKILEALGRGRAVVSTSFAAEGLGLRGGVDLEFADTPTDIAARCLELLKDRDRRRALATAGRATVADRFDWISIERALPGLICDAVRANSVHDGRPGR
jgi:polysaccharide biosynthesis protein PslH